MPDRITDDPEVAEHRLDLQAVVGFVDLAVAAPLLRLRRREADEGGKRHILCRRDSPESSPSDAFGCGNLVV